MNYIVNKVYGTIPQKEDEGINIYAFIIKAGIATIREREDVYIETLDVNYPLNEVQEEVLDFIANATLKSYHPSQQNQVNKNTIRQRQAVVSAIHVIFDKRVRKLLLTEENSDIKQKKESFEKAKPLFKKVAEWMSENAEFFGEDQEFEGVRLEVNNRFWNQQNYVLYPIETFPYIVKSFSDSDRGLDFLENANILAINMKDEKIKEELSKQIPESWEEFSKNLPYILIKNLSLDGRNINAPIIIIDRMIEDRPKNEYIIERELYTFLANYLKVPATKRLRSILEREAHVGYDIQDIFYLHFNENGLRFFANIFDAQLNVQEQKGVVVIQDLLNKYGATPEDKKFMSDINFLKTDEEAEDILNKYDVNQEDRDAIKYAQNPLGVKKAIQKVISIYGINPNDKNSVDFVKNYIIYTKIFPLSDKTKYHKTFYNVVSVLNSGSGIPKSPVTKNDILFINLFSIVDGPLVSENRIYYLISSDILFPEYVFNLFCDSSVENERITNHEVFEFNKNNGMLSKNSFVNKTPVGSQEIVFYTNNVMSEFPRKITEALGSELKDNRFKERLTIKTVSEMPYVYERVKKIIERHNLEQKDQEEMLQNVRNLNIVFMSDPRRSDMLGGYLGKIYDIPKTQKTAQQGVGIKKLPATQPTDQPINPKEISSSDQAVILASGVEAFQRPLIILNVLNEKMQYRENLSHILVHECRHYIDDLLREKGNKPRKSIVTPKQGFVNYLNSEGEQNAFTEEALNILSQYNTEYVKRNWSALKTRIIKEYFGTTIEIPSRDRTAIMRSLSRILDRALNLYINEKTSVSSETSVPTPASSEIPVDNSVDTPSTT